jgi:hypothetical protein
MNTSLNPTAIATDNNPIISLPRHNKEDLRERVNVSDVYAALYPTKFSNQKKGGNELLVSCYAHDPDNNPSMAINETKQVFHCHACGESGDVFHLVQKALNCDFTQSLEWVARFVGDYVPPTEIRILPAKPVKKSDETITRHDYGGGFVNERHDPVNAKKYFKQFYQGVKHDKLKHPKFPMYRQSECVDAIATGSIWIHDHEGEKCCDYAWEHGYPSTTTYGNMKRDEYLETYQGLKDAIGRPFKVIVYQDAQDGERKARYKAETLTQLGIDFVVLDWTKHLDKKSGDIVDYVELHGVDKFRELVNHAVRSQSPQSTATAASSGGKQATNLVALPAKEPTDLNQLRTDFEQLLSSNPKKSQIQAFKAQNCRNPEESKYIDAVYQEYLQSTQLEDEKQELLTLTAKHGNLDLNDFLDPDFARPLKEWAAGLSIPEQAVLTALLPVASHFAGQADVCLWKRQNHIEHNILFALISGKSGSGKSTLISAIARNPLRVFQAERDTIFKQNKEAYESWKRLPAKERDNEDEPVIPKKKLVYINNYTAEAIHRLSEEDPEAGALVVSDEYSGVLLNQGKYSGGRGNDKEEMNQLWNAHSPNVSRSSSESGGNKFHLNVLGATQPETLHDLITSRQTESGEFARYIFCELPYVLIDYPLVDSDMRKDFTPMLVDVYRRLQKQEKKLYYLTPEAFRVLQLFRREVNSLAYVEVDPGYQKALKKSEGVAGRLALVFHLLDAAIAGESPDDLINLQTMEKGIRLMRYYLQSARKLYTIQASSHTLTPDLDSVLTLAKRKGSITPGDVARAFSGKRRKTGEQARALMVQLADMGIGQVRPSGKSIVYIPPSDDGGKVDNVDRKLIKVDKFINDEIPVTASITDSGEGKVDKVDKNFNFPTNREIPPVTSNLTSGCIDHLGCHIDSENISTRDLSTLSTLQKTEPETQSGSGVDCVDKVINFVSTELIDLSTLEKKDPNRVDPSPKNKDPNRELTLEDLDYGGVYCLEGRRVVVTGFDWASQPPVIDVRFEDDGSTKTIFEPRKLRFV